LATRISPSAAAMPVGPVPTLISTMSFESGATRKTLPTASLLTQAAPAAYATPVAPAGSAVR
jgi:hypothetical protein